MKRIPKSARPSRLPGRSANNILNNKKPKIVSPRCYHQKENQMSIKAIRDLLLNDDLDEIEKYATYALMGEKLPELTPHQLSLIAKDLENRRAYLVDKGMYQESLQAKSALDTVRELMRKATQVEAQKQAQADIFLRKGYTRTDYTIFNHKMTAAEDRLNEKYENKLISIEERQEKEKQELDEEWHSKAKLRMYYHPSTKLIELRHIARRLLEANELDKAAEIKREIDELAEQEKQQNDKNWSADYHRALETLNNKHECERNFYQYDKDLKKQAFQAKVDIGTLAFDNRSKALDIRESLVNDLDKYCKTHTKTIYDVSPPPIYKNHSPRPTLLKMKLPN